MGLGSIIANAVATAKSVTGGSGGLQIVISRRACTGWSGGVRQYATTATFSVLIEQKEKMVRGQDNQEHLSQARIYFLEPLNPTMEDEITLPDGSKPQILAIDGLMNSSGIMYNPTVYF